MRPLPLVASAALKGLCRADYHRFLSATNSPALTQERLLASILEQQEATEWGKVLGVRRSWSREEFRERVPLSSFDAGPLSGWVERQLSHREQPQMCAGGARAFERTSGSSGRSKLIPYNRAMLGSFEKYFRVWCYDLLIHGPAFHSLRMFLSVSPVFRTEADTSGGIGLEDDSEYLSPALRWLLRQFLSVPLSLKSIGDRETFFDHVCALLAADPELEIISVWHPSLFLILWDHLVAHRDRIVRRMEPKAARRLASIGELTPEKLWPNLKLVSAWDAANSHGASLQLRELLPQALFQGKGLLATEAPMTLPLVGIGQVPFLTEVLFEFVDDNGDFFWLDQLELGRNYSLVISQRGGLLRYQIKDRVKVTHLSAAGLPHLEFIGRAGDCSDLVGEKLTASYVTASESALFATHGAFPYCLIPKNDSASLPHYEVLFDMAKLSVDGEAMLAQWWEENLQRTPHYRYARKLGQLGPVRATRVNGLSARLTRFYEETRGMRAGDIKLKNLVSNAHEAQEIRRYL